MKTLGKSAIWWFIYWPRFRKRIKFYYKKGEIKLAESYLRKVLPESAPGDKAMIRWLAKRHKW